MPFPEDDDDFDKPIEELPGGGIDVNLDADFDEDDEQPGRWRRKKGERLEHIVDDRTKDLRAELEEERRQRQATEARLEEFRKEVYSYVEEDEEDPHTAQLDRLAEERSQIQAEWNGLTPEAQKAQLKAFEKRMLDNERDRIKTISQQAYAEQARQQQAQDPKSTYELGVMRAEYGDVMENDRAWQYANAEWAQQIALGATDSLELKKAAAQKAREKFKTSGKRGGRPSEATKRRYAGEGRSAGAPPDNSPARVRLDRDQKAMADARWPELPERQRYGKMAELIQRKRIGRSA